MKAWILSILLFVLKCATAKPVTPSAGVSYLFKFGHFASNDATKGSLMTDQTLVDGIKSFQRFAGLPITGEFDRETLDKMSQKRCGNSDVSGSDQARKKRYALAGGKWDHKHITYKIENYSPDLTPSETDTEIKHAFNWWADESGLMFSQVHGNKKADIVIKFAAGNHGDGDPFDGAGQTLAHAYFPRYGGDAHFDEDETWLIQNSRREGVKLRIVAAHEFGHSLGLSHSDANRALMAPFYNSQSKGLENDDIEAIQHLYGDNVEVIPGVTPPKTTTTRGFTTTTRPPKTTRSPPVGACNGRFDAITRLGNGSTYAFLGSQFWRLNDGGRDEGYPQNIRTVWGIDGKIDAALTFKHYTDIFQGSKVYRFSKYGRLVRGYPTSISSLYYGIPDNINAAFQWSGNGKLYFMKGDQYWRFNPSIRAADNGYPRDMKAWRGLPNDISSALQWHDRTYFFKDGFYYRFDDEKIEVAQSLKHPYPRRADRWWLGCQDNTLVQGTGNESAAEHKETDGPGNSASLRNLNGLVVTLLSSSLMFFTAFML